MSRIWAILTAIIVLANPVAGSAETMVMVKNDFISPDGEKSFFFNGVSVYFKNGHGEAGGVETSYIPAQNFLGLSIHAAFTRKPWYGLTGIRTDGTGRDFLMAGVWYFPSSKKISVIVDARNLWALSGGANNYIDNFVEVLYKAHRLETGMDFIYDHWWGSGADWFLTGPVLNVKISPAVKLLTRISKEWSFADGKTASSLRFRLGAALLF